MEETKYRFKEKTISFPSGRMAVCAKAEDFNAMCTHDYGRPFYKLHIIARMDVNKRFKVLICADNRIANPRLMLLDDTLLFPVQAGTPKWTHSWETAFPASVLLALDDIREYFEGCAKAIDLPNNNAIAGLVTYLTRVLALQYSCDSLKK
jgi:hypothetical protein